MTQRYTFLTLSKLCVCIALIIILMSNIDPETLDDDQALAVYIMALVGMFVVLVSGMQWLSRNDLSFPISMHPPVLMSLWSIMLIGVPGLISFYNSEILIATDYRIGISYPFAAWGLLLITVSLICLWIGYALGLNITQLSGVTAIFHSGEISPALLIAFYIITILARLLRISVIGISYQADRNSWGGFIDFGQWISYLEGSSLLILAVASQMTFQRRCSPWLFVAIIAAEILFAFTSGTMKALLWLALVVGMNAVYFRFRFRRYALSFATFVFLGILIVPITEELRLNIQEVNTRAPVEVLEATIQAFQRSWGQGFDVGWAIFTAKIVGRQAEISQNLGAILRKTPSDIPHQGFDQFLAIPAYIIPRAIWQDKPILSRGIWFSITYLNYPDDTVTSSAMTIFGESYLFAGWAGALVALFLLGFLQSILFRKTMSPASASLFIALAPKYVDIEGQYTTMIVEAVQQTAVLLLVYWLLLRLSNSRKHKNVPGRIHEYGSKLG